MSKTKYPLNRPQNRVGAFSSPFALSASYLNTITRHISSKMNQNVKKIFQKSILNVDSCENNMTSLQFSSEVNDFLFYRLDNPQKTVDKACTML